MSFNRVTSLNPKYASNVCATCLSVGCEMDPPSTDIMKILKLLLTDFDFDSCLKHVPLNQGLKLCMLCHKTLEELVVFKETALKSLNHLKTFWHDCLVKPLYLQSNLQTQIGTEFDCTTIEDSKIEIKIEPFQVESETFEAGQTFAESSNLASNLVVIKKEPDDNYDSNLDENNTAPKQENDLETDGTTSDSKNSSKNVKKSPSPKLSNNASNRKRYYLESDDDSDSECKTKKKKHIRWYLTMVRRSEIVRNREEKLKDSEFIDALYKCNYCVTKFKDVFCLLKHNECCHGQMKDNAEFRCFVCGCSFDSISLLSKHVRYHSLGCHTYQCATCEYTTGEINEISKHKCPNEGGAKVPPKDQTMRLSVNRRQFYCPKCDYTSLSYNLNEHYQRFHSNEPTVDCNICGITCQNRFAYESHMRTKHPSKPREKKVTFCEPCGKSFLTYTKYRYHMESSKHAPKDQPRFQCDECPKKIFSEKLLMKHKMMHLRMSNGEFSHKCTMCDKGYFTKTGLNHHVKAKHTEGSKIRDQICNVCGSAFADKGILRHHMARHSDARPYKCDICGDTFKYSASLYTHKKFIHKKKTTQDDKRKKRVRKPKKIRQGCGSEKHGSSMEISEREQSIEIQEHEQSNKTQ